MTAGAVEEVDEEVNEGVDERSMSVSRDTEAEVDLQGQDEFHQQGERAKHKHQKHKEETLYIKLCNFRSTASRGSYVNLFLRQFYPLHGCLA